MKVFTVCHISHCWFEDSIYIFMKFKQTNKRSAVEIWQWQTSNLGQQRVWELHWCVIHSFCSSTLPPPLQIYIHTHTGWSVYKVNLLSCVHRLYYDNGHERELCGLYMCFSLEGEWRGQCANVLRESDASLREKNIEREKVFEKELNVLIQGK